MVRYYLNIVAATEILGVSHSELLLDRPFPLTYSLQLSSQFLDDSSLGSVESLQFLNFPLLNFIPGFKILDPLDIHLHLFLYLVVEKFLANLFM
jgi:hypothetical protein